ncbi:uncharacterized protein [Venturia canescens]|uniref:uncharacterized protein n=1 Tax=Venturia canescens TaxID=32260 RepID=UPI001C9BF678|nr:uncharacterized protein LOC122416173 [Venturia canescens]
MYFMASDLYILCVMIRNIDLWDSEESLRFLVLNSWLVCHAIEMVLIVAASDSTVNEANRTGRVLHRMLINANMEHYACMGQLFSLRLLHRHLTISFWGLLRMRLSIVYTVLSTVVIYVTIMMQFDGLNL